MSGCNLLVPPLAGLANVDRKDEHRRNRGHPARCSYQSRLKSRVFSSRPVHRWVRSGAASRLNIHPPRLVWFTETGALPTHRDRSATKQALTRVDRDRLRA
jgi:hypothetical protein